MRSARMFEIIQILRRANGPLRAQDIAETLEVTKRTIYRDIAALQARCVPIDGAAGIGYILRPSYDLPPVNFNVEDAEAITLGLSMIPRTGDRGLQRAARRAADKLAEATAMSHTVYASNWVIEMPKHLNLGAVRAAIREERKLALDYHDVSGTASRRTVKPVALIFFTESLVLAAWCELRRAFRHFRPDRMISCTVLDESFAGEGHALRSRWAAENGFAQQ